MHEINLDKKAEGAAYATIAPETKYGIKENDVAPLCGSLGMGAGGLGMFYMLLPGNYSIFSLAPAVLSGVAVGGMFGALLGVYFFDEDRPEETKLARPHRKVFGETGALRNETERQFRGNRYRMD